MNKSLWVIFQTSFFLLFFVSPSYAHLCDNVFRQADKLIVKPETYNLIVKDKITFKIFLQNNMDRGIDEISLLAESPVFNFTIAPEKMRIPKNQRVFFTVTMATKPNTKTGNYPINFRLVGGGRQFKSFNLNMKGRATEEKEDIKKEKLNILQVKPTFSSSPKLDGVINEKCWKSAAVASNFSSTSEGKAIFQTVVLLTFDKKYLHFGIYCSDDNTKRLSINDKVEILLATEPSGYPYYSVTLPAVGLPYFKKILQDKDSSDWNAYGINYSIKKDSKSWTTEVSIPFFSLNTESPVSKEKWYLRIIRTKASGYAEESYWSADSSGYNSEKGFGEFLLVP